MKRAIILTAILALALLVAVGCEREVTETIIVSETANCFGCHGDNGYLLQAKGEWANSVHASGTSVDYTNRGGSDCTQCHNHQGFLEFLETGAVSAPYDSVSAIHCFTCHAPHERGDLSLRIEDPYVMMNDVTFDLGQANLCANCHHSRTDVRTITDNFSMPSRFGPHHGPQAEMIVGTGGYHYTGFSYTLGVTHADVLDDGCIECHMGTTQAHAGYHIGGHSFAMEDEEGDNISGLCRTCHTEASSYDFVGVEDSTDYDWDGVVEGYQTEMEGLLDSLRTLLVAEGLISGSSGLSIPQTVADAGMAGAVYNYAMAEEDHSLGSHNFQYAYRLVLSSINYINTGNPNGSAPTKVAATD